MKSSAPWSVKGIERDARETAKEAARREGMTVGEWLNQVIYTASDPASSNGQIEGLKISDLVNAIEHVSKRVIGAENRNAEAFDALSRSLAGFVERVQRLERARPAADALPEDVEARLQRLEERSADRGRVEALNALERAVSQVALQFDAAQKGVGSRLESLERQIQQVAGRIDLAGANANASGAIDHLKNLVDGLSVRLSRVERAAADAHKHAPDPAPALDPEFVERTGTKLRVLGDEIKRGGDQIRNLEAAIKKLAIQIDAAERRSSEGVQKVADTITELKGQFTESETQRPADHRADIEAAIADSARRTEERIGELQRSFEAILDRIERVRAAPAPAAEPAAARAAPIAPVVEPVVATVVATGDAGAGDEADAAARQAEIDEALSAFDVDPDNPRHLEFENDDVEFDLADDPATPATGLEGPPAVERPAPSAILADVEAALAGSPPSAAAAAPSADPAAGAGDDIDSILAELEGFGAAADAAAEAPAAVAAAMPAPTNYLQEARRAAKEAAEKAAAETAAETGRRKLTPKQRAILAAKIRRKRQAAEQAAAAAAAPAEIAAPAAEPREPAAAGAGGPTSLIANLLSGLSRLKPQKAETPERAAEDGDKIQASGGQRKMKPLTLALGAALILAVGALALPLKDLVFGAKPKSGAKPPAPRQEPAPSVAATAPEAVAPEIPSPPVIKPRALYLDSVARLKSAKNDADTREALKGLQEAAALGHPPAQLQLGELYKLGQGVAQDPAQARAWYERAANGGNILAMHRLGVMSARGQGGAADQAAAIRWFETAANLGLVDSQYNLGAIYHPGGDSGAGVQDAGKAYFWYAIAARNGDTQANELAVGLGASLPRERKRALDADIASWTAGTPDPDANEVAPAS